MTDIQRRDRVRLIIRILTFTAQSAYPKKDQIFELGDLAGPETPQAIDVLVQLADSRDPNVGTKALNALLRIRNRIDPEPLTSWLYQHFLKLIEQETGSGNWTKPENLDGLERVIRIAGAVLHEPNMLSIITRFTQPECHPKLRLQAIVQAKGKTYYPLLGTMLRIACDMSEEEEIVGAAWAALSSIVSEVKLEEAILFLNDLSIEAVRITKWLVNQTYNEEYDLGRDDQHRSVLVRIGEMLGKTAERMEKYGCYDLPPFPPGEEKEWRG